MGWLRLAALLCLCGTQLQALSCMRPDVVEDYRRAEASKDVFLLALGELRFDPALLLNKKTLRNQNPPDQEIPALLTGNTLTTDGFTRAFTQDITLRILCFGPWCGTAQSGQHYLIFLRQEPNGLVADASPCGGMFYADPTRAQIDAVRACARGTCPPSGLSDR